MTKFTKGEITMDDIIIKAEHLITAIESNIEHITVPNRENEPVVQLCFIFEEIENLKRELQVKRLELHEF
tara:strand:- start:274 stop:483 length:210 start_codon:yes stop_codon:yes gene_type:complete